MLFGEQQRDERDRAREREREPDSIPRGAHCYHLWMLPSKAWILSKPKIMRKQTNQASFIVKYGIPSQFFEHPEQIKAHIDKM